MTTFREQLAIDAEALITNAAEFGEECVYESGIGDDMTTMVFVGVVTVLPSSDDYNESQRDRKFAQNIMVTFPSSKFAPSTEGRVKWLDAAGIQRTYAIDRIQFDTTYTTVYATLKTPVGVGVIRK